MVFANFSDSVKISFLILKLLFSVGLKLYGCVCVRVCVRRPAAFRPSGDS